MAVETAVRAADFIASIGVNAHLQETSSSYGTSNVAAQMAYLGIDNMRVSDYVGTALPEYEALGAAGIKFDLITVIAPQNSINLATEMADINQLASYTISVEGANEVNTDPVTYDGLTGVAAATAFQKDLYTAVHADSLLAGVKVLPFSLSVGGSLTGYGNVSAYADEANVHGYASDGVPPDYMLSYAVSSVTTVTGKPVVMTETGYYTLSNGTSGVTQDVQAKWLMDTLLENYSSGVVKTYLYQLEDGGTSTTDPENNYGLYTAAGTPKQAAVDIHNLTTILADTGSTASTFTPGALNYTVTGLNPDYGYQELFAKSDGSFNIALWSEPDFFDAATDTEKAVTPSTVTVALGGNYTVEVFDPVIGTTPIATYTNVSSVTVSLTTDPLIIDVLAAVAVQSQIAAPITIGSGSDTLALSISEDAWKGDAQFTISVDGVQVGGTQTATTANSAGNSQIFNVLGTFSAGKHSVSVNFLNDAYGGTAITDRNLYVTSSTIDGTSVTGGTLTLMSSGSQSFGFTEAAAASTSSTSSTDTLDLHISEDAWKGDAQFTVSIDGVQIGGTQTATASHAAGATQDLSLSGNWGLGAHNVAITFINDAYNGTAATDRNLYVNQVSYDGQVVTSSTTALMSNGAANFTTPTSGTLTLLLSEDAYQGNAQFTVTVDGKQIGQASQVTAAEGLKQLQAFNIPGVLAAGVHDIGISFINDQYGGTSTTDRNLYVKGLEVNGTVVPGASASMLSTGTDHFSITIPHS